MCVYICSYVCFHGCKIGRWFLGCPTYQSSPGKDGFRINVSMTSQSSSSRSLLAASLLRLEEDDWDVIETLIRKPSFPGPDWYAGHARNHRHIYIYINPVYAIAYFSTVLFVLSLYILFFFFFLQWEINIKTNLKILYILLKLQYI